MTYHPPPGGPPPSGPPPPPGGPPPGGFRTTPGFGDDPRRGLHFTRNILIAVIILIAVFAIVGMCSVKAISGLTGDNASVRNYITANYQRDPALDEGNVDAYVAQGTPSTVASELSGVEQPTDQRAGDATNAANVAGTEFLQYPDYVVGLFPLAAGTTKVMLSRDYRSGYNHFLPYVGGFWVPTPNFGGSGSSYRGGGSGGGGK
ncbi:DUF4247 domain-containing protein [Gordonia sp. HNM0687]|uniref:DUF4247 domain-containing protein n=1 Tax=Gordonia mangrovi TaxID=2665643 RepID=A0A6L7GYR4_9ACTN|nr:DUF4247 domain-containing protein [Gordonia mangrovi]MXP23895.1 DUF4247 domain-containing protein [Gordonia mangrovi]UVF76447.1 DUF4247 domain-containing protein [Gordonia mangrovi]